MASSISRRICSLILSNPRKPLQSSSLRFCTNFYSPVTSSDPGEDPVTDAEQDDEDPVSPSPESFDQRTVGDRPLQDGLDPGIYKAILVGRVGQNPIEKRLKSGRRVTMLSVGTGGIRNNRRPMENEEPRDYANRSMIQWHRVSIYPERLGALVAKNAVPGAILYLEGNLETKIFNDPISGLARRVREIAIRRNGRVVFLGNSGDSQQPSYGEIKGVGYY